jgi:hypothetical protein
MKTTVNLVGAWRLTASYFVDQQTGQRCDGFDADVFGSALFDRTGRMTVLITSGARTKADTDSDRAGLFTSMVAYTGKWTIDDEKLITQVDGAWDPTWIGTEQVRYHAFDGQTLSFRTAPIQLCAFPGREVVGYVDWQRDQ